MPAPPFAPLELRAGGLSLEVRSLGPGDADAFAAHVEANLEHLGVHLGWPARTADPDGARAWLAAYAEQRDGRRLLIGAWDRGRLEAAALLMLHDEEHAAIELGCWASEAMQGRGVVRRLCLLALGHAHGELGVHRVVWEAAGDNHRSRALAQRLGFRFEGRLREAIRHDGRRLDLDVFSLVGPELAAALEDSRRPHPDGVP